MTKPSEVSGLSVRLSIAASLAIGSLIVGVTLYIGRIETCNAEQDKDIHQITKVGDDHEDRLRVLEETVHEIKQQRGLLEQILDAVKNKE